MAISEIIADFSKQIKNNFGGRADIVQQLVGVYLQIWDQARRAVHVENRSIVVIPVGDPRNDFLRRLISDVILPEFQSPQCLIGSGEENWHSCGFTFPLGLVPGCDNEGLLLAIAESMEAHGIDDWMHVAAKLSFNPFLRDVHVLEQMRRYVWSGVERCYDLAANVAETAMVHAREGEPCQVLRYAVDRFNLPYQDEDGVAGSMPAFMLRRNHTPTFIAWNAEMMDESALWEMRDIADRAGGQFILFGVSHSPEVFGDEFCSAKADGLVPILDPVGPIPNLDDDDRRCYHDAIVETVSLIAKVQTFLAPSLQGDDLLNLRIPFEFSQELIDSVRQ